MVSSALPSKMPIQTLDDFGQYDWHIITIGLDLLQRTTPLFPRQTSTIFMAREFIQHFRCISSSVYLLYIQTSSLVNHLTMSLSRQHPSTFWRVNSHPYINLPMMYLSQMYQYESPPMGIPASYPTLQMPAPAMPLQIYTDPTPQVHHAPPQSKLSMGEVIKALTDMNSGPYVNLYQAYSRYPMFPTQPPAPPQPSVAPQPSAPIPEVASPAAPPVVKQEVTMGDPVNGYQSSCWGRAE